MFKSIWAIVAGYLSITLLTLFTFVILAIYLPDQFSFRTLHAPPSITWQIFLLVLSACFSIFAGMLTWTLSPKRPAWHVHALALVVIVMGSFSAASSIPMGQPVAYAVALPIIGYIGVEVGGRLQQRLNKADLSQIR